MIHSFIFVLTISFGVFLLFFLVFLLRLEYKERKLNKQIDELLSQDLYDYSCNVIDIYDHKGNLKNEKVDPT